MDVVVGTWRGGCYACWIVLNSPVEKVVLLWGKRTFAITSILIKTPACRTAPRSTSPIPLTCRFWVPVEFQGLFTTVTPAQGKKPTVPGEFAAHCPPAMLEAELCPPPPQGWAKAAFQVLHPGGSCLLREKGEQGSPCREKRESREVPSELRWPRFPQPSPAGQEGGSGYHTKLGLHFLSHHSSGEKKQKPLWKPTNLTLMKHKTRDQLSTSGSPRQQSAWLCLAGTACVTVIRQQSQHLELINWFVHYIGICAQLLAGLLIDYYLNNCDILNYTLFYRCAFTFKKRALLASINILKRK